MKIMKSGIEMTPEQLEEMKGSACACGCGIGVNASGMSGSSNTSKSCICGCNGEISPGETTQSGAFDYTKYQM